jgi:hypothetical protein
MRRWRSLRRPLFLIINAALIALGVAEFASTRRVYSAGAESPILLFTVAKKYDALAWMRGGDRFSADATVFLQDGHGRRPLAAGFAASADPAVSFDGTRILFAAKRAAQDTWQIWEVDLGGDTPQRVTSCAEDCVRPLFVPDDRVAYAKKTGGRFVVEIGELPESKTVRPALQLTYGPGNSLPSDVLRDGRILFESSYPLGKDGVAELYTVYSDGSGVEAYRCDHGRTRYSGRQVGSGDIMFATRSRTSDAGLGRFTSARAQAELVSAPAGNYAGDVAETTAGEWLVAWRPDEKGYFQVKRWKPGERNLVAVVEERNANVVQPTIVEERATPKRHPSGLHEWPNANLLCLNAYTSKSKFVPGSIRSVRMYTRDDSGNAKLLGTAPAERDGSFFVQVATEQPLQVELLDASGKTLKREAGWFWMRRGEQRACVGCHAGPETSPENAVPMVLLKSTTPADLTGNSGHAAAGGH